MKILGKRVTIINRSQVVGQPLALMLQQEPYNATVTVCHEHTADLHFHTLCSDIIVTAVGKYPDFDLPDRAIPDDCTVIDVAMNKINDKLTGDVIEFEQVSKRVKYLTAVPGGVGPLTIACLMRNTLIACELSLGILK
jgi:methylenetetrahydrofolate dehydrogenase (NADP+)/methenyltetrahydrofolate cyclohydrolase